MSQTTSKKPPEYNDYQRHIGQITQAALAAVDPYKTVERFLKRHESELEVGSSIYDLAGGRVFLIGVGKAAIPMTAAAVRILGDYLYRGVLIAKSRNEQQLKELLADYYLPGNVAPYRAGHPTPDEGSVSATTSIIEMLQETTRNDLVICLISGGTSALLTQPILPLEEWQELVQALLGSGCPINEMNTVRKQLDTIKGGGLLHHASPATCISLVLSDVVGNPLDMIGSGPTVPNPDPPELAREILLRYGLDQSLPDKIWNQLDAHLSKKKSTRPQEPPGSEVLIVGDIRQAAVAAVKAAANLGFDSHLLTAHLEGEAREVGRVAAAIARDAKPGSCLILGGETTVTIRGDGVGGRNQECVLAAVIALSGTPGTVIASIATDGDDGPTDAAGAIATGETLSLARAKGLKAREYLVNNDSYSFFSAAGGLIKTGLTGTNVTDLLIILKYETR